VPSSAQNFVLLHELHGWPRGRLTGLDVDGDGAIVLARVPAANAGAGIDIPGPYEPLLAALAVGQCGEVLLSGPGPGSVLLIDDGCGDQRMLSPAAACADAEPAPHGFTGFARHRDWLLAARETAGRIDVFAVPGLELSSTWHGPFEAPRRLALDGTGRIYVLDAGRHRLLRLDRDGRPDRDYDSGVVPALAKGLDLAVSAAGAAFVSVSGKRDIRRFAASGAPLEPVVPPDQAAGLQPGALACDDQRLYVADRASGGLWVYNLTDHSWLGRVPRFRAPVTGLAVDRHHHLWVRTGSDTACIRLDAGGVHLSRGVLFAGPFDAGERCAWMRVHADVEVPEGSRVRIETALGRDPGARCDWRSAPALDSLVHPPKPPDVPPDPKARYLWIRVHLETDDPSHSPRLHQITAETPGDDYLSRLPGVYARRDAEGSGFLRTWLEAFRAELGDRELEIAHLARRLDPALAPRSHLDWLAGWIAFDFPAGADTDRKRALLLDASRLYELRGTVRGLREMVRLYSGVECEIVETFRSRRLWMLNESARLGFDTGLLAALPDGMVVPGPSLPEPWLQGLRTEYFLDDHLGNTAGAPGRGGDRCQPLIADPMPIDVDGQFASFKPPAQPADRTLSSFSVLWTGQVRARYSELYSFYFVHDGGARVYIDGQLLIDSWVQPGRRAPRGSLPLRAGRWYQLRIEYWSDRFDAAAPRLSWSSRSQQMEVVPQDCLYAGSDDNINPDARSANGGDGTMVVGDVGVGAHGPLAAEDFGAPLFDDAAHHFTVRVTAADAKRAGTLDAIRAVLDAEKPAHTEYHLCVVEPTFLVGSQARVGIDAYVAPVPPAGRYGEGRLGLDARLGLSSGHDDGTLRVDETLRIGGDAILR
jgi:phage tail-like protein